MKTHPARVAFRVIGLLWVTAAIVFGFVGVWSGDVRWGESAFLAGCCGALSFFTSTYPRWDR